MHSELCAVGRTIFRSDRLAGLDWSAPCDEPPIDILRITGYCDLPLCSSHWRPVADGLYERMVEQRRYAAELN